MRQAAASRAIFAPAVLCVITALLSGCSGSDGNSAQPAPSPRTSSDTEICIALVGYWAKEVFLERPTSGRDFMQKGLSNGQNEILLAAVKEAKKERERSGEAAALKVLDRHVEQGCEERYRNGKPSEGFWRDPTPTAPPTVTPEATPAPPPPRTPSPSP